MKDRSSIGVLCPYGFPEGMAPTTRILAYSKGLVKNGIDVDVICFFPKTSDDANPDSGVVDGISYHYVNHRDPEASMLRRVLYDRPLSILRTLKYVYKRNKACNYSSILLSFDDPIWLFIFALPLMIMGIKTVFIGDEYPEPIRKLKSRIPYVWTIGYKLAYLFIQKRILMTNALQVFYDNIVRKPTYIMSSVLDEDRFAVENVVKQPYLCYMGNMMLAKDNVDNIIRAFSMIEKDIPDYTLRLYGTPSTEDKAILDHLICDLRLKDRVMIMGRVGYSEVPRILAEASILVTSQPNTQRAEGGFPTKMGEYMMSKTPMIVTNVGEISEYVQDGFNTFMVEPEDPVSYSKKIKYVVTHPVESNAVALNAYKYATERFGCESVTSGLAKFLC